jgi:hypothetical protein
MELWLVKKYDDIDDKMRLQPCVAFASGVWTHDSLSRVGALGDISQHKQMTVAGRASSNPKGIRLLNEVCLVVNSEIRIMRTQYYGDGVLEIHLLSLRLHT